MNQIIIDLQNPAQLFIAGIILAGWTAFSAWCGSDASPNKDFFPKGCLVLAVLAGIIMAGFGLYYMVSRLL